MDATVNVSVNLNVRPFGEFAFRYTESLGPAAPARTTDASEEGHVVLLPATTAADLIVQTEPVRRMAD